MASITSVAEAFFAACETGKGWAECRAYCTPDATFAGYFLLQGFKIQSAGTDEKITSVCVSPQANSKGGSDVTNTAYSSGTLTMNGTYTVELTSGSTVFGTGTAQVLYIAAAS